MVEQPTFKDIIDGKYSIVKRLDISETLRHQVYLVQDTAGSHFVVKLFTDMEQPEFASESERNIRLVDSEYIVKMIDSVSAEWGMPSAILSG